MKHLACILPIILLLLSSCATLNISEIQGFVRVEFDSLKLGPGRETNNLRIDLIRQMYQDPGNVYDSIIKYSDTPYHPLGFDLGNGIFYDLNKNFSLRVDYLLGFQPDHNFELTKINRPEKNKGIIIYLFKHDSLTLTYPNKKKVNYEYHQNSNKDSVAYMHKNRFKYAIVENDTSLIFRGKKTKWDAIIKINENQYYKNKRRGKENYQIKANDITLNKEYIVSLTNNNKTIEIKKQRKGEDRIIYTVEKSNNKIYIYNKKYAGVKIIHEGNIITIFQNSKQLTKYELNNKTVAIDSPESGQPGRKTEEVRRSSELH